MAEVAEAPLKRKLESSSKAEECKKSRDSVPLHTDAVEPAPANLQEAPAQSNGEHKLDGQTNLFEGTVLTKVNAETSNDRDSEFRIPEQVPCSSSLPFEEPQTAGRGEVLEGEHDDSAEMSELDTENDSDDDDEDEDEDEDAGSDDNEDDSDDGSDNEEEEEPILTSNSSSLRTEGAHKGKGKEKIDDVKGKGKAIAEDESGPVSDEDDAGYLSEDPLEEVDLNNILPTRTRRRSSTHHYDFVDQGDDIDDDEDDSDA